MVAFSTSTSTKIFSKLWKIIIRYNLALLRYIRNYRIPCLTVISTDKGDSFFYITMQVSREFEDLVNYEQMNVILMTNTSDVIPFSALGLCFKSFCLIFSVLSLFVSVNALTYEIWSPCDEPYTVNQAWTTQKKTTTKIPNKTTDWTFENKNIQNVNVLNTCTNYW